MRWTIVSRKKIPLEYPLVIWSVVEEDGDKKKKPRVRLLAADMLDAAGTSALAHAVGSGAISGRLGGSETVLVASAGSAPRVVLVCGVGSPKAFNRTAMERAFAACANQLQGKRYERAAIVVPREWQRVAGGPNALGVSIAKAMRTGMYRFTRYQSEAKPVVSLKDVALVVDGASAALTAGLREGEILAESVNHVRDWSNMPANDATPTFLAEQARGIAKEFPKIKCTVFDKAKIQKEGMGGIWGVAKGTREHPTFIIMEYFGARSKSDAPLVLAGKAVTFDSGGISIKPSERMEEMKYDMAGGAAVIAALRAIAALKLSVNVVGLVPATENLPGGEAYKPGDILRTMSGKTIEVITTDAEGRVILADALHYAKRYKPAAVVDIATLTGAVSIALGHSVAALLGNDQGIVKRLKAAGETSGERVWELPLLDEYKEYTKSDVADLKNITGRQGGVISGAAFLEAFISPEKWAHLDIGATAYTGEAKPWQPKGATGWGVHLFVELAKLFVKRK